MLLLQNRVAPVSTFAVVYHVGSRNEAVGHTGATHLLEHLMFKGTPEFERAKGTAVAAVLEALGARFNATTWFDRTNYYETIPSDKLEIAVRIEASRMRRAYLRDEDRAPEMTVVRNEFERGENSPFQVLYKHTFATAFREHPYHHPTIGWRSDIEEVSTERLREFYDTFYHPNNATAMVIGDFEEAETLELLARAIRRSPGLAPADPEGATRWSLRRKGSAGSSCAAPARSRGAGSPGERSRRGIRTRPPLAVLGNILGGGITSRLHQALVEKSLALSVTVVPWQLRDPALFSVFAPVRPGVEVAEVESVIRQEIARIAADGVTEAECDKARTQIEAEVIFDRDSTDQIAASLSEAIAVADWEWYADYPAAIRAVTPEDVRRVVARAISTTTALTVGLYLPNRPPARKAKAHGRGEGEGEAHDGVSRSGPPAPSLRRGRAPAHARERRPLLRPREPLQPDGGDLGLARAPAGSTRRRTGAHRLDDGGRAHEGHGAADQARARRGPREPRREPLVHLRRVGSGRRGHLGRRALARHRRAPRRAGRGPADADVSPRTSSRRRRSASSARSASSRTRPRSARTSARCARIYPPAHPLHRLTGEERIDRVEALKRDDLASFYGERYGAGSLALVVVGDVEADRILDRLEADFGDWAPGPPDAHRRARGAAGLARNEIVSMPDKASADVVIASPADLKRMDADYLACSLANSALGQSSLTSRLGVRVRDTEGLTYGIHSSFSATHVAGPFVVSLTVKPDSRDAAVASTLDEIRRSSSRRA